MKPKIALLVAAAALLAAVLTSAGLAGRSSGSPSKPYGAYGSASSMAAAKARSRGATVGVQSSKLGRILVDGRGRALYVFEKDKHGKSSCNGACAIAWPPLIVSGKPRAKSGVRKSLLGTTTRKDGRWQVTYNRHPLYTFVQDTKKGQTNGEGVDAFGAEWYLVSPAGAKVEKNVAKDSSGDDPAPGGYGGYGP
jgi:predicted lipoprotein with Yx(FWY)xxD motif